MVAGGFGKCRTAVGMLVLRECGQPANQVCVMCNKPICEAHQAPTKQGIACPECAASLPGEEAPPAAVRVRRRQQYYSHYHYTPLYFYDDDYHAFDRRGGAHMSGVVDETKDHDFTES